MSTVSTFVSSSLVNNVAELPYCDKERVVGYLRTRFLNDKLYTWVGNVLLCIQPFKDVICKKSQNGLSRSIYGKPSVETVVNRVWFRLTNKIGKRDQAIVVSGDSGSGKTYSTCLAIRAIAEMETGDCAGEAILRQAWASVPLLSAFGNAPTNMNTNSSRFGKLLRLQYIEGKLTGAMIETYLIEKSRIANVNNGEGNFHIFRQILESLDDDILKSLYLCKSTVYRIAPKVPIKSAYADTIKSIDTLNITEWHQILTVLSVILNLGNVSFQENTYSCHGDGSEIDCIIVSPNSEEYLKNVATLLQVSHVELAELLCTVQFAPLNRHSVLKSPCTNIQDCEFRRDSIMKYLYERLFCWLVTTINLQLFQGMEEENINLLDLYGFEVFDHNTFEQLCINYANERLQHYFNESYLLQERQNLMDDGHQVETMEESDFAERISLIDGSNSIFGILNEECAMKRFNSNVSVNTRLAQTFRHNKHFFVNDELAPFFSIRHYAGLVKYDTTSMIAKNKDKVPSDIIQFLKKSNFNYVLILLQHDGENIGNSRRTVLNYFKTSFDKLINIFEKCDVHYIKCLKPNDCRIADFLDEDFFAKQLRYNGIFEIMKLLFQNYPIKMNLDEFSEKIGFSLHEILKAALGKEVHISKGSIFMTEKGFFWFQRFKQIRMNQCARIVQNSWSKYMRRKHIAASLIQNCFRQHLRLKQHSFLGKYHNLIEISNHHVKTIYILKKVQHFLLKNMVEINSEGMPLSLQLEKTFNIILTKKFKRALFFGDRIVSYYKLAEVPIRFHCRTSCIRYSHLLPKSELSNGLADIYKLDC